MAAEMKKILVVDDEPNIVMSLEYIFKKEDFQEQPPNRYIQLFCILMKKLGNN